MPNKGRNVVPKPPVSCGSVAFEFSLAGNPMRYLKYAALAVVMAAIVGIMVFLETQTDVIAEARQAIGMPADTEDGQGTAVAVNTPDNIVERVVNWRAYSGTNRHLPPPPKDWTRVEVADLQPGAMDAFIAEMRPSQVGKEPVKEVNTAEELGLTGTEAAIIDQAGKMFMATSGFTKGGALYRSGDLGLVMALMRTPRRYGGIVSQMMQIRTLIDPFADTEMRVGRQQFKVTRPDGDAYVTVEGQIGNLYTFLAHGNVSDDVLIAFIGAMDLDRLEAEGVGADDPMDAIGPIGKLMMQAAQPGSGSLKAQ